MKNWKTLLLGIAMIANTSFAAPQVVDKVAAVVNNGVVLESDVDGLMQSVKLNTQSGQVLDWTGDVTPEDKCHCCQFPAPLRPHVVWFGEMPLGMDEIYTALSMADIFIAIGTSGHVYLGIPFSTGAIARRISRI